MRNAQRTTISLLPYSVYQNPHFDVVQELQEGIHDILAAGGGTWISYMEALERLAFPLGCLKMRESRLHRQVL